MNGILHLLSSPISRFPSAKKAVQDVSSLQWESLTVFPMGRKLPGFVNQDSMTRDQTRAKNKNGYKVYFFITETQNILCWTQMMLPVERFFPACIILPWTLIPTIISIILHWKVNFTEFKWQIYHLLLYFFCIVLHFL